MENEKEDESAVRLKDFLTSLEAAPADPAATDESSPAVSPSGKSAIAAIKRGDSAADIAANYIDEKTKEFKGNANSFNPPVLNSFAPVLSHINDASRGREPRVAAQQSGLLEAKRRLEEFKNNEATSASGETARQTSARGQLEQAQSNLSAAAEAHAKTGLQNIEAQRGHEYIKTLSPRTQASPLTVEPEGGSAGRNYALKFGATPSQADKVTGMSDAVHGVLKQNAINRSIADGVLPGYSKFAEYPLAVGPNNRADALLSIQRGEAAQQAAEKAHASTVASSQIALDTAQGNHNAATERLSSSKQALSALKKIANGPDPEVLAGRSAESATKGRQLASAVDSAGVPIAQSGPLYDFIRKVAKPGNINAVATTLGVAPQVVIDLMNGDRTKAATDAGIAGGVGLVGGAIMKKLPGFMGPVAGVLANGYDSFNRRVSDPDGSLISKIGMYGAGLGGLGAVALSGPAALVAGGLGLAAGVGAPIVNSARDAYKTYKSQQSVLQSEEKRAK